MHFLVDAQLPPALAQWLNEAGHVAHHVVDYEMADASDVAIWQKACELKAFVVTKDADFFLIAGRAGAASNSDSGVVWLRVGNTRTPRLLEIMGSLLAKISALASQGERFIEVGHPG
jgi:predicted nuclease of predicted toxin-antitoxin system